MRQFIYNHGNGQQDYYIEFNDTEFTIIPVSRYFFADIKWEGINMSGCLADIMRNDEKNWKNRDLSYSATGLSKEHLMATKVELPFVLSELYKGTYHEDLCTACKGYCCSEVKTSGDGMPDNVVCALRVFELPYFPEDSYEWIKDARGIESHCDGYVAFLKKNADGKCRFLSDTGCQAPVKPLACAQFSCLGSGPFNSEIRERVGDALYAKYSNRRSAGQTEGNRYKEITTSKVGLNLKMFQYFIGKLEWKNERFPLETDPERSSKLDVKDDHELKRIINEKKYREELIFGMNEAAEIEAKYLRTEEFEIALSDSVTDILLKFPVLRYYPEVSNMLLALSTKGNSDTLLLNVFNYILIKERSKTCSR